MGQTPLTATVVFETFLILLIGIGPKLAIVPFLQITAPLDAATARRVASKMLITASVTAVILIVLGESLRALLHFSIGALSIAGGAILLVLAVEMVVGHGESNARLSPHRDPMQLAHVPLAVPYLLNPVGIVALVTLSANADTLVEIAVTLISLGIVLLLDLVVFRGAKKLSARLNEDRMLVTEKVFGFLIAAIAVQLMLDGLASAGVIAAVVH
jgi:multiple antibiotic resistance protein